MTVPARQQQKADLGEIYDSDKEQEALARLIEPRYVAALNATHELIEATFPTMESFRLDDAATRHVLATAAEQVVRIDETTRAALREMMQLGQQRGYSNWEIANGVPGDDYPGIEGLFKETWRARAGTVARNELGQAQHVAAADRYAASGLVDRVRLRDGTGKHPDQQCGGRDGDTRTVPPYPERLHINCTLVMVPLLRADLAPVPRVVDDRMLEAPEARRRVQHFWDAEVPKRTADLHARIARLEAEAQTLTDWVYAQPLKHLPDGVTIDAHWMRTVIDPKLEQATDLGTEAARLRQQIKTVERSVIHDIQEKFLFQPTRADDVKIKMALPRDKAERAAWERGVDWWRRLVGQNHGIVEARTINGDPYPVQIKRGGRQRAFYNQAQRLVSQDKRWNPKVPDESFHSTASTTVHELTHFWEYNDPYIRDHVKDYFHARTDGEAVKRLKTLYPNKGYSSNEIAKPDQFIDAYAGKVYRGDTAHEVAQMAAQWYLTDPIKLAREDPALFDWFHELIRRRLP